MDKKAILKPNEFLAIIVILVGSLGFVIWGIGIGLSNSFLSWFGGVIVGLIVFFITIVSRWLK